MTIPIHTTPEYERSRMAKVIAEVTSGVMGAEPEPADFELADAALGLIESKLSEDDD